MKFYTVSYDHSLAIDTGALEMVGIRARAPLANICDTHSQNKKKEKPTPIIEPNNTITRIG